jgi:TolB-like protein/Tfp pilus assembly protein PilF
MANHAVAEQYGFDLLTNRSSRNFMFRRFLNELAHRRVLRTAVVYAIATAAVVEFTDIVTPALGLPAELLRWVIRIALVGFPLIIVLSWFFDLTSLGVVKGKPLPDVPTRQRPVVISILLISLLGLAVVYLGYRLYWETQDQPGFERGKSIAVLPFTNIVADTEPETAYFSDGVAEEILYALAKVDGLRVAARASSFALREHDLRDVGEALNVSVVLVGSVRRAGNRVRISAQLVDTATGIQLWSDVYRYELQDVFRIQEEIAVAIVKALQLELLGDGDERLVSPGTTNLQAYDKYLEGRNFLQTWTPAAARQARSLFEQAIELDPDYAQAYAGLADSWITLREVGNLSLMEATLQSHDAISRSIQLNNLLPEAQASLGLCILGGGDPAEAARQFQKAIDLDPEYVDAYLLRANLMRDQGYLTEATRVYTQALALDPLSPSILENQAVLFAYQGRFDQAIEQLVSVDAKTPGRLSGALALSRVWSRSGNNEKALEIAHLGVELAPQSPVSLAMLVDKYTRLGNFEKASTELARMNGFASNNETAITATMRYHLMTGEFEALDHLAASRLVGFVDNKSMVGSELLFNRAGWAAMARLALGDAKGAIELFEIGIPEPSELDPNPSSVRTLAMFARALGLEGDPVRASEIAEIAAQLGIRSLEQGWGGSQLDYALAGVAASKGSTARAMEHLQNAIDAGWDDFIFASHDPAMTDIVQLSEFQTLSGAASIR